MDFENPFLSPFSSFLPPQHESRHKTHTGRDSGLSFSNDITGASPLSEPCNLVVPSKTFHNPFSRDLQDDEYTLYEPEADVKQGRELFEPLRLIICRTHLTNTTQLCDPLNRDVVYTVKETFPYALSPGPDLEIVRSLSGDVKIGSVRYGVFWDEMETATSGKYRGKLNEFRPRYLREAQCGKALLWRIKRRKTKPKWSSIDGAGLGLKITQPLLIFELVEEHNADSKPLCRVSMFTTRPIGMIEVFAKSACVNNEGGDWMALDELVLSAYANMDRARMRLMSGSSIRTCGAIDKTDVSWPDFVLNPMIATPDQSPDGLGWI